MDLGKVDSSHVETSSWLDLGPLAPFQVEKTQFETHVRVFWGRCLVWLVVMVTGGWLALAGGAYFYVKYQRGFSEVTYSQVLKYPINPTEYRRAKGEFFIEEGKAKLEEKNYLEAFQLMRLGLLQVPEDNEARFYVAEVFHVVKRHDLAAQTLEEGIPFNTGSVSYLQRTFSYLFQVELDDRVVALTKPLLEGETLDEVSRQLIALAAATAHFNRGRYYEARTVLADNAMSGSRSGATLNARMLWEENRRDEAIKLFAALQQRWPENREIHDDYVICLRAEGLLEDWRLLGVATQLERPADPQGYADEMGALAAMGETAALPALEEAALARFSGDAASQGALEAYAAQAGRPEFARRLYQRRREAGLPLETAAVAWVEAGVASGDAQLALAAAREVLADNPQMVDRIGGLRAVAMQMAGQFAESIAVLESYLQGERLNAPMLLPLAIRFRHLEAIDAERRVLARAVEVSPLNREASVRWIEWTLEHGEQEALYPLVQHLLTLRKPPVELLQRIRTELRSDRFLMLPSRDRVLSLL